jgi:cyanate lyase
VVCSFDFSVIHVYGGTEDETADRNGNGIIDAIDDTQDVIKEIKFKGSKSPKLFAM